MSGGSGRCAISPAPHTPWYCSAAISSGLRPAMRAARVCLPTMPSSTSGDQRHAILLQGHGQQCPRPECGFEPGQRQAGCHHRARRPYPDGQATLNWQAVSGSHYTLYYSQSLITSLAHALSPPSDQRHAILLLVWGRVRPVLFPSLSRGRVRPNFIPSPLGGVRVGGKNNRTGLRDYARNDGAGGHAQCPRPPPGFCPLEGGNFRPFTCG